MLNGMNGKASGKGSSGIKIFNNSREWYSEIDD